MPIVYSSQYRITVYGLEWFHPFDSHKYDRIYQYLTESAGIPSAEFLAPLPVTCDDLMLVHTPRYLHRLEQASTVADILGLPVLSLFPGAVIDRCVLRPMRHASGGTVRAVESALREGWAINLSGGYHHAAADNGAGFCMYADGALAVKKLHLNNPALPVLIVDLDAHHGDGTAAILGDDRYVHILDSFRAGSRQSRARTIKRVDYPVCFDSPVDDSRYLSSVEAALSVALSRCRPELILYNAGTDIYSRDRTGAFNVSAEGIRKRDELVFTAARDRDIPIAMTLSGGYHHDSAGIIGSSIAHLYHTVLPHTDILPSGAAHIPAHGESRAA